MATATKERKLSAVAGAWCGSPTVGTVRQYLPTPRLQRLFAVACARRCRVPDPAPGWWGLRDKVLDGAESLADETATQDDRAADRAADQAAYWAADRAAYSAADWAAYWAADWAADRAAYSAADQAADWAAGWAADWAAYSAADRAAYWAADRAADQAADWAADWAAGWAAYSAADRAADQAADWAAERRGQGCLLASFVRPEGVTVPASDAAAQLARAIYADKAFDRLPILADALEESGFTYFDTLDELRGDGEYTAHRGYWLLDDLRQ